MLHPKPELPDDTLIDKVQFDENPECSEYCRFEDRRRGPGVVGRNAANLYVGLGTVTYLRETFGLPSCDGVRLGSGLKAKRAAP